MGGAEAEQWRRAAGGGGRSSWVGPRIEDLRRRRIWIDDLGASFFPAPDCVVVRKRRRDDAPAEDDAESSFGVDERSDDINSEHQLGASLHQRVMIAMLAKADGSGETHIVLCRVLMGRPEVVTAGSLQSRPSSDDYDSAVDKLENPKWYVIWNKDMNTRVLPEYVVSFKCPKLQPIQDNFVTCIICHPRNMQNFLLQLSATLVANCSKEALGRSLGRGAGRAGRRDPFPADPAC
ncbi:unnamed protein product [Urochloa humidicola]